MDDQFSLQRVVRWRWPGSNSRWIAAGRIAWVAFALLTLVLFARGVPVVVRQIESCASSTCSITGLSLSPTSPPNPSALNVFAAYVVMLEGISLLILFALSIILLRRKTDRRIALVGFSGATFSATSDSTATLGGAWQSGAIFTGFVGSAAVIPFPDGRLIPRWARWAVAIWLLACVVGYYAPPEPIMNASNGNGLGMPIVAIFFIAVVVAQTQRYRRHSSARERQRIKWVVGGSFAALTCLLLAVLGPAAARLNITSLAGNVAGDTLMSIALLMFPAAIVIAIVKTHLWDIDRIINRALVYAALSACLIGIYVGTALLLERLFNPLTGQSDLAIALSTLVVAAFFNPVRHRIQAIVDRRFYRQRYDTERALSRFGLAARDEVDLGHLTTVTMQVIDETIQLAHVSVWLPDMEAE